MTQYVGEEWSRLLTVVARSAGRRRSAMLGCRRSRLPLVRPGRSLLCAPPGARPRRTTRGRVSRPGRTGRTSRRLTTVAVTVRSVRLRLRRHAATTDVVAAALVSDTAAAAAGTTPAIAGVTPSTGRRSYRLLVVLQHLGHCCLHGSAGFLALLAQLTAQGQGGCPGGAGRYAWRSSCSSRLVRGVPAGCAHYRQTDEGQDPDYDRHDETSKDEKKRREEDVRRRNEDARQSAHHCTDDVPVLAPLY